MQWYALPISSVHGRWWLRGCLRHTPGCIRQRQRGIAQPTPETPPAQIHHLYCTICTTLYPGDALLTSTHQKGRTLTSHSFSSSLFFATAASTGSSEGVDILSLQNLLFAVNFGSRLLLTVFLVLSMHASTAARLRVDSSLEKWISN